MPRSPRPDDLTPAPDEPRGHEPPFGPALARHYLSDLVYGANDGIITTFAVVSGVTGAALSPATALILGFANLLADGFSMGASNFLSIRSGEAAREWDGIEGESEPYPHRHAIATFASFVVAGVVPLLAYAFAPPPIRFQVSIAVTLATLFIVGALRAWITTLRWWRAGLEMLAVGATAAAVAYGVGSLLEGFL